MFSSRYEKKLWIIVLLVILAIFSTLFIGSPLVDLFKDQNTQAWIFGTVMIIIAITIWIHGIKSSPGKLEWTLILGMVAVYMMLFLRLGLAERSHLMEYSVLAIFIHRALNERCGSDNFGLPTAIVSFIVTFSIGIIDESIQYFLPNRVFDTEDIIFNGFAAFMAMAFSLLVEWVRSRNRQIKQ